MDWLFSEESVNFLLFILPGFVTVSVFYLFTSHPRPAAFEQIIQASIFTIIISTLFWIAGTIIDWIIGTIIEMDSWNKTLIFSISFIFAVILGLSIVYLMNNDTIHRCLRNRGFTKETSYPSEWYSAFSRLSNCYVVLHMSGGRRLYGWPTEWPSSPGEGHFFIEEGEWLSEKNKRTPITGVTAILVSVSEVEMVEFLPEEPVNQSAD